MIDLINLSFHLLIIHIDIFSFARINGTRELNFQICSIFNDIYNDEFSNLFII